MSVRNRLQKLRQFLTKQDALNIHGPAMENLVSCTHGKQGEWKSWRNGLRKQLSASIGSDAGESDSIRVMVGSVAVIPVLGVIVQRPSWITRYGWGTSTEQVCDEMRACMQDDRVSRIVMYCDTPGGTALGNEELGLSIEEMRKIKPIETFARGMICSAGYYLGCAAGRMVASPSTIVGSVGTIQVVAEYSRYFQEAGITPTVITHGKNKGAGNPYQPLTAEGKATLQKTVTAFGEMFDAFVARQRGVTPQEVRERFGQGAVFLAEEAKQLGMIDAVSDWDPYITSLLQKQSAGSPPPLQNETPTSTAAGVSADDVKPVPPAAAVGTLQDEDCAMSKRLKAALFARGIVGSYEASDEVCSAALTAFFAGIGKPQPSEEQACLDYLNGVSSGASTAGAATPAPASNVQSAHDNEMAEARKQTAAAAANERTRIMDLQSRGKMLNMGEEAISAAIASNKPLGEVLTEWTAKASTEEAPLKAGVKVLGETGMVQFSQDALAALSMRVGVKVDEKQKNNPDARRLSGAPLVALATQFLNARGVRIEDEYNKEEIVAQALQMDPGRTLIRSESDGGFNRVPSFPNLMSGLAGKIMDQGIELAEPTYPLWAGRMTDDLPDFKPAPIINKSQHDELDEVLDKEAFKEAKLQEEMLAYLQLARYGNTFVWSPYLIANDDMNALREELLGFGSAWENTVNRLNLKQLAGNPYLLDNNQLWDDTNHKNDILGGSGGVPSDTQWKGMLTKYYAQRGVGGTGYVRGRLGLALIPPTLEREAMQTFVRGLEQKAPATDSNINIYRGSVEVVQEPELQNYSLTQWYGLQRASGSLNATVVYCYFRGFGRAGKRERWYDPTTKSFCFSLEGRVGSAAKQYRTGVRNAGA